MMKDDYEAHERTPMFQMDDRDLSRELGNARISDSSENPNTSLMQTIRSKFTSIYLVLGLLFIAIVAVLVVVLILLFTVRGMSEEYMKMSNFSNPEEFMKLYEELMRYRTTAHLTTNSMIDRLTPQQLEMAKLAGILPIGKPLNHHPPAFGGIPPITPVTNSTSSNNENDEKDRFYHNPSWHNPKCKIECEKQDIAIPPLLIISLDGFSREYLDRGLVPTLDTMAECGARAEFMFPSYPSKTFPNHYSIATGLYPESHGIVDNAVYDPEISSKLEDMKNTKFDKFYRGEPIWSLAVREHRRMFCLFWPGCSYNITGYNPTINMKYNKSMTYSARVDLILEWLLLPAAERPSLIMAYFDQPDSVGHFHTTDQQVNLELSYVESVLNHLFVSLYKHGILDCTNIVILSDHGMQFLNKRIYVNELIDSSGMLVANGVVGRIHIANSTKTEEYVRDKLKCYDDSQFQLYDRVHSPKRFHYSKTDRIGNFFLNGNPGTIFFPRKKDDYNVTSDHGYDYLTDSMHAIFFSRGPNIKPGVRLQPFQNIELFNLFADLLRLNNDVPTNGTLGILDSVYNHINVNRKSTIVDLNPAPECPQLLPFQKREVRSCSDSTECENITNKVNDWLSKCSSVTPHFPGTFYVKNGADSCFINYCSFSLLTNLATTLGRSTILYETLNDFDLLNSRVDRRKKREKKMSSTCPQIDLRYDLICDNITKTIAEKHSNDFIWQTFEATPNSRPFTYLQNLTHNYMKRYKKVVSMTGTIYDFNMDGLADDADTFWKHQNASAHLERLPTHFFRILMRCDDDLWHVNGMNCRNVNATRILAFVLPNQMEDLNCLDPFKYLLTNTARIKDIELLTNVQFFSERLWFSEKEALFWRTNITTSLWEF